VWATLMLLSVAAVIGGIIYCILDVRESRKERIDSWKQWDRKGGNRWW